MPPRRFVLSLRAKEKGGGAVAAQLYRLPTGQSPPTPTIEDFAAQLASNRLVRLAPDQASDALGGRTLFLVHGFNVSRSRGLWSGEEVAGQPLAYDAVVAVLWPGDSASIGPLVYPKVLSAARDSAAPFAAFLTDHLGAGGDVSFATHSFGVRVVMETLRQLLADGRARRVRFADAIFMAAADDHAVFQDARYRAVTEAFARFVVLSSFGDDVLKRVYPLGDWFEDLLHRGERGDQRALGRYGPTLKAGDAVNGKVAWFEVDPAVDHGHDHYLPWPWETLAQYAGGWNDKRIRVRDFMVGAAGGRTPRIDLIEGPKPPRIET